MLIKHTLRPELFSIFPINCGILLDFMQNWNDHIALVDFIFSSYDHRVFSCLRKRLKRDERYRGLQTKGFPNTSLDERKLAHMLNCDGASPYHPVYFLLSGQVGGGILNEIVKEER